MQAQDLVQLDYVPLSAESLRAQDLTRNMMGLVSDHKEWEPRSATLEALMQRMRDPSIYRMRARLTREPFSYVTWRSPGSPDTVGDLSGYDPSELTDILVLAKEKA